MGMSLSVAAVADAHDIWLRAARFSLNPGDTLLVRQLLSEQLAVDFARPARAEELPVMRNLTPRFSLITRQGTVDLLRESPRERAPKPVLERRLDFEGLALIVMEHGVLYNEFANEEFVAYLEQEGLDRPQLRPHMAPPQIEGHVRTLKSLVRVGSSPVVGERTDVYGRVVGLPIEIVLLQNPYELAAGGHLDVRVLLGGEPLDGVRVDAYSIDRKGRLSERSVHADAGGVARFRVDAPGVWLVRLVHVAPCSEASPVDCEEARWESYWASYSFAVE